MVDIPKLRECVVQANALNRSAPAVAVCLAAALDEIEERRQEVMHLLDCLGRAEAVIEAARHHRDLRTDKVRSPYNWINTPSDFALIDAVNAYDARQAKRTTDCPSNRPMLTPFPFAGHVGEPGEMSRPRVDCIVDGQAMEISGEVQMRTRETSAP